MARQALIGGGGKQLGVESFKSSFDPTTTTTTRASTSTTKERRNANRGQEEEKRRQVRIGKGQGGCRTK